VKSLTFSNKQYFAISAGALASVTAAVVLQAVQDLTPCPLCILQRVFLLGLGLLSLARAMLPQRAVARIPLTVGAMGCALACAVTAGQHYYEQTHPLEFSTCAPGFESWWNELLPARVIPLIFKATGQCMLVDVTILGMPLPLCSLAIALAALAAMLLPLVFKGRTA
jgi:disulfide bond formation protein DsbB